MTEGVPSARLGMPAEPLRQDVMVSMTSVPWRLTSLGPVLHSLFGQSLAGFTVGLYIPSVCRRTSEPYVVPESLFRLTHVEPRLRVITVDEDLGPATKLLPAYGDCLSAKGRPKAIITVDDDVVIESHAIEELVEAHALYPSDVLGFMGVRDGEYVHAESLAGRGLTSSVVSILGGYRGVLYPVEALDVSLFDDLERVSGGAAFLDDDHLIAWNLARRGVTRRVISTGYAGAAGKLNIRFLHLPGGVTFGADDGAGVMESHRKLIDYYETNCWSYPL